MLSSLSRPPRVRPLVWCVAVAIDDSSIWVGRGCQGEFEI